MGNEQPVEVPVDSQGNEINVEAALAAIKKADEAGPVEKVIIPEDHICPRCDFNATLKKVQVREDDREEYFRSIMGMRPYAKKFEMWNGNMTILMSTLTNDQADRINKKLRAVRSEDEGEIMELSVKLKLLFMCRNIITTEKELEITVPENLDDMDIAVKFSEVFQVPEPIIRLLSGLYTEFELLVDVLGAEGFDENFYKGGGDA